MTSKNPYSLENAAHSLTGFLKGRAISAIAGIAYLLTVIRTFPASEYGVYITAIAILEIFYLATGFGLSTMAQRYVAEYRIKATPVQFREFLIGLLWRRTIYSLLASAAFLLVWASTPSDLIPIYYSHANALLFTLLLVAGSGARYLDEVYPALLMQQLNQRIILTGTLLKLCILLGLAVTTDQRNSSQLLLIELAAAVLMWATGTYFLFGTHLRKLSEPSAAGLHVNRQATRVAYRFYFIQMLGQTWSPNAARVFVAKMEGALQAGIFGFAYALTEIIRNYLPIYLLANWIRPVLIARYLRTQSTADVVLVANMAAKASAILLTPLVPFFMVFGDDLASWISNGRYRDNVGIIMATLTGLLIMQCQHLSLTMICATLEHAKASIYATAVGIASLPIAWLVQPDVGILAAPAALIAAEAGWIAVVMQSLRNLQVDIGIDWRGTRAILLAGLASYIVLTSIPVVTGIALLLPLVLSAAIVALALYLAKPLSDTEMDLVRDLFAQRKLGRTDA